MSLKKHLLLLLLLAAGLFAPLALSGCKVEVDPDEGPVEDAIEDALDN